MGLVILKILVLLENQFINLRMVQVTQVSGIRITKEMATAFNSMSMVKNIKATGKMTFMMDMESKFIEMEISTMAISKRV